MDGGSGVSNTARPPHQWGFGVAFLCGDDRDRKGRVTRGSTLGGLAREQTPPSLSPSHVRAAGDRRATSHANFLFVWPKLSAQIEAEIGLVWSGLLLNARRP